MTRIIWLSLGWIAVGFAFVGVFLPIVPTVPFLLVAAWAFGRSSERLRQRLLSDPIFGPDIKRWHERGAIRRPAKVFASLAMGGSILIGLFLGLPAYVLAVQAIILLSAAAFILSRPEA